MNKNNKKMTGKSEMQKSQGKGKNSSKKPVSLQSIIVLIGTAVIAGILVYLFPDNRDRVVDTSLRFFYEMISILPAIVILIGLFAVFVPKQMVADYLGHASGVKGFLLAIFLGALPTGPLYVAFPIAAAMLKKGARAANMIVFLTAWACIKLPQEMVELKFMGLEFTLLRFSLTVTAAVVMGLLTERLMKASENPA